MELLLLGPVRLRVRDVDHDLGAPKQRAVLVVLALHHGRPVSSDAIIDAVWGMDPPPSAHHSVQTYISGLRRIEGLGSALETVPGGYRLQLSAGECDLHRFELLVAEGLTRAASEPTEALVRLDAALALWRGPALGEFEYAEFAQAEIRRLEELHLDAEDARDRILLRSGHVELALANVASRVSEHPLREPSRAIQVRGLALCGRQAEALRSYRDLEVRLASEVGIAPSTELVALEHAILRESAENPLPPSQTDDRIWPRRASRRRWPRRVVPALVLSVVLVAAAIFGGLGASDPLTVALVFGGRGDLGVGDLAAAGLVEATAAGGLEAVEVVPLTGSVREIEALVSSERGIIIGVGYEYGALLSGVLGSAPASAVAMVGLDSAMPGAASYVFAGEEGSYLAGVVAAHATLSGVVGFVGGWPLPMVDRHRAGFEAGVAHVDPTIRVVSTYLAGTTDAETAFLRPDLGAAAADRLIVEGVDVIHHSAGFSGWGVVDAVVAHRALGGAHVWVIGDQTDQWVAADPGQRPFLLTSVVDRFDSAIEIAVDRYLDGTHAAGVVELGLAEDAVGLAISGGNVGALGEVIEAARRDVVDGTIDVPTVPSGEVLAPEVHASDAAVDIGFWLDGRCTYGGPAEVAPGTNISVTLANRSGARVFLGIVPFGGGVSLAEAVSAPIDATHALGALVAPGMVVEVPARPLDAGAHLVVCVGEDVIPAALVMVVD